MCLFCSACGSSWLVQPHSFTKPARKVDLFHLRPLDERVVLHCKNKTTFKLDPRHDGNYLFSTLRKSAVSDSILTVWEMTEKHSTLNLDQGRGRTADTYHQHLQVCPVCWIFNETENRKEENFFKNEMITSNH